MFKLASKYDIEELDNRVAVILQGPMPIVGEFLLNKDLNIDIETEELEKLFLFLNHMFAQCLLAQAETQRKNTPVFEMPKIERV